MNLSAVVTLGLAAGVALGQPVEPGVANFHLVNDHVYRGAQPGRQGFESLARLAVRTVVDLRGGRERARAERRVVEAAGMRYVNLPVIAPSLRLPSRHSGRDLRSIESLRHEIGHAEARATNTSRRFC
jgi:protein tyrosine phosphatase (PTP) superfamily phosphohydrolase (DUF442 family)